jgi:hypothetical protein
MAKLFNGFVVLLLIAIISVSVVSGLSITASIGANGDSSSAFTQHGATINDHVKEQIQLKPDDNTLSDIIYGTGTLPYKAIAIKDSKGNYAQVYRSVTGIGTTTYNYDWNTQKVSSASGSGVSASLTLNAKNANIITGGSSSYNREGDKASADIEIKSDSSESILDNYHTVATAFSNSANAYQSLGFAAGDLVDVKSHAQNTMLAKEYLSYSNGQVLNIRTKYGGADFWVQSGSLSNTETTATATSSNVVITPILPQDIKTAIMLEPYKNAFVLAGTTDLGSTVFPDLVASGYATLRYTDSGASSDKFQNLGDYDVALVNSHMNSEYIGLSTGSGYISADQLNYVKNPSKDTLVILSGCESFAGIATSSGLYDAVSDATLSGGFKSTVGTLWSSDYISYFIDALSQGKTAQDANIYAESAASSKYASSVYNVPLTLQGDQTFKL